MFCCWQAVPKCQCRCRHSVSFHSRCLDTQVVTLANCTQQQQQQPVCSPQCLEHVLALSSSDELQTRSTTLSLLWLSESSSPPSRVGLTQSLALVGSCGQQHPNKFFVCLSAFYCTPKVNLFSSSLLHRKRPRHISIFSPQRQLLFTLTDVLCI